MFLTGVCPVADSCPVLCSGNGLYEKGRCACLEGWKGAECNVEEGQCIDPTCSNHGSCIQGICICNQAYKGVNCEQGRKQMSTLLRLYTGGTLHVWPLESFSLCFQLA